MQVCCSQKLINLNIRKCTYSSCCRSSHKELQSVQTECTVCDNQGRQQTWSSTSSTSSPISRCNATTIHPEPHIRDGQAEESSSGKSSRLNKFKKRLGFGFRTNNRKTPNDNVTTSPLLIWAAGSRPNHKSCTALAESKREDFCVSETSAHRSSALPELEDTKTSSLWELPASYDFEVAGDRLHAESDDEFYDGVSDLGQNDVPVSPGVSSSPVQQRPTLGRQLEADQDVPSKHMPVQEEKYNGQQSFSTNKDCRRRVEPRATSQETKEATDEQTTTAQNPKVNHQDIPSRQGRTFNACEKPLNYLGVSHSTFSTYSAVCNGVSSPDALKSLAAFAGQKDTSGMGISTQHSTDAHGKEYRYDTNPQTCLPSNIGSKNCIIGPLAQLRVETKMTETRAHGNITFPFWVQASEVTGIA